MITVCMATYNGEKYIKEQIDSILLQLSDDDELIISDDSSTDSTLEIIDHYKDSRIKIFQNNNRNGVVGNFENALQHAEGDYIFLSDQDDVWLPCKVQICISELQSGADVVVSDAKMTDKDLNVINESIFKFIKFKHGYWNNLKKNRYIGCCMAFNRNILKYALPFPSNIAMHDMWIALLAGRKGTIKAINIPLILFRRHDSNASATGLKSNFSTAYKIKYRAVMLIETLKRTL